MRFFQRLKGNVNAFAVILLGFAAVILLGAVVLSFPAAARSRIPVPFINALFTSASAVCVTGLVVYDTALQWSLFGKIVILILIQTGGLGVVTMFLLVMLVTGKRIGIFQRLTMQEAVSAPQIGGIVRFTRFFLIATLCMEGMGAIMLWPVFAADFGLVKGLGYAIFHSVSAFCNAGFDLMGVRGAFSSFESYSANPLLNITIVLLIILGGLGYLTWQDLITHRFRFERLRLQSKIILSSTAALIIIPFLFFLLLEFGDRPLGERILVSLFQAVTPRTAGFSTVASGKLSETGQLLTVMLMLVGGAPGSTAGGMKVTTFFVLIAAAAKNLHQEKDTAGFHRRIEPDIVANAFTLLMLYITLALLGTFLLSRLEHVGVLPALFESASALGTVGLSTGITPRLTGVSKLVLILFMYFGRVGGITIAYAMLKPGTNKHSRMPSERITVG